MRAIVVYESESRSTECLAYAVSSGMALTLSVELVPADSAPRDLSGYSLVVVGAPAGASAIPRWMGTLDVLHSPVPAAAFGTGAQSTRDALDQLGFDTSLSLRATEGELDAAAAWARDLSLWAELRSPVAF